MKNRIMKQTPILFSTPMVQSIQEDRKTKTRRTRGLEDLVIDTESGYVYNGKGNIQLDIHTWKQDILRFCPYGNIGDVLWVRETWGLNYFGSIQYYHLKYKSIEPKNADILYKADVKEFDVLLEKKWKPSIHMPKAAARIWLEIIDVRVERLQDISEEDAIAEGVYLHKGTGDLYKFYIQGRDNIVTDTAIKSFASLWISINGQESWSKNPWVWVVSFKKVNKPS